MYYQIVCFKILSTLLPIYVLKRLKTQTLCMLVGCDRHFHTCYLISECLPTQPLHTPGTTAHDAFLHVVTADTVTGVMWVWVCAVPLPENVLPSPYLPPYPSQVSFWNAVKDFIFADSLFRDFQFFFANFYCLQVQFKLFKVILSTNILGRFWIFQVAISWNNAKIKTAGEKGIVQYWNLRNCYSCAFIAMS